MKYSSTITKVTRRAAYCAAAIIGVLLSASCDSMIYDEEGDCAPKYRVRLCYDWNMKFTDAFPQEVDHVTLNVVDSEGNIVHTHLEGGEALGTGSYEIVLDDKVKPGKYRLHAWCGGGAAPGNSSFHVHEGDRLEDVKCTLKPDEPSRADVEGAEGTHVTRPLDDLYHGLTEELEFPDEQGTHVFTVPLKKNTNEVKVVLQQMTGGVDPDDFDYIITSANARMDHDNSIIEADPVTYHAWDIRKGTATVNPGDDNTGGVFSTAVAEFTIARLMENENVALEIHRKSDGKKLFSVNMVELALLVKSAKLTNMDSQEYLDRVDDYNFIFFLDSNMRWTSCHINILSWTIIKNNVDL